MSELTGQTIPIAMIISLLIKTLWPDLSNHEYSSMHERDGFSAKTLGKSLFHFQTDWSGNGPAGQF